MKKIELTNGKFAIVDNDDFVYLSKMSWHYDCGYASHTVNIKGGRKIRMHRFIMNTPEGFETDHINGNGLDNRKSNLRICTRSQNQHNSKIRKDNKSGYKGVSYKKNKWIARIVLDGNQVHLGSFDTPEDAAECYARAAQKYYGEFARKVLQ